MIRSLLSVLMLANITLLMADTPTPRAAFDPPQFAFDPAHDLETWQRDLRRALRQTLLLPKDDGVPLQAAAKPDSETADHVISRIEFTAEQGERVPGYLLLPKTGEMPFPVMICLQGHAPGMHISIGRAKNATYPLSPRLRPASGAGAARVERKQFPSSHRGQGSVEFRLMPHRLIRNHPAP